MEPPYDELDGVISTISGYIGGTKKNPTKVYRYGCGRDQRLQEL
jgi:peptide methionine sulfoxide reductase MsrA